MSHIGECVCVCVYSPIVLSRMLGPVNILYSFFIDSFVHSFSQQIFIE